LQEEKSLIEIDGSQKSGSGTIVRYAVSLASLLGQNLHLTNIRFKRDKPGLRPQHLKAIIACNEIVGGKLEGAEVGSQKIFYQPGKRIKPGKYAWDIGTAGSTTMLIQTILPLACFAPSLSRYQVTGGLFQDFAPEAHHLQHVVIPLLAKMGIWVDLKIIKPGYVPKGGGVIEVTVKPIQNKIQPLILTSPGKVVEIKGTALASHLQDRKVSERMAESCNKILAKQGLPAKIDCIYDDTAIQRGASLTVYAITNTGCIIGADFSGKLGRTSENIGERVANMLLEDLSTGATVDRHTADQLILYAALASGTTQYIIPRMTEHIDTNLWLIKKILGANFKLKHNQLTIHGIGFKH
jgi:RNA 3'-terminal phosphate cyclase (ATP)